MAKLAREGKGKIKTDIKVEETKSGSTILFGPVRLSYLSVFKPRPNKKRKNALEFSLVALIEKDDDDLLDFIDDRLTHAKDKVLGKKLAKWESPLRDGDDEINDDGDPIYPGFMFLGTRAEVDQPPFIYGPNGQQLDMSDAQNWVSGDWGYIRLDVFGYDNENKGVSTRLKAIQFSAKDEPFGRGSDDPDAIGKEFGSVEGVEGGDEDDRSSRRRGRDSGDDDAAESRGRRAGRSEERESGGSRRRSMLD